MEVNPRCIDTKGRYGRGRYRRIPYNTLYNLFSVYPKKNGKGGNAHYCYNCSRGGSINKSPTLRI